jgi:hypothetical protein
VGQEAAGRRVFVIHCRARYLGAKCGRSFLLQPGFCFLLAHEVDAVRVKVWKRFPVLNRLGDEAGCRASTALRIPIYALLLWRLFADGGVNRGLIVGLHALFIVHVFLHLVSYCLPDDHFGAVFSYVLIFGAPARLICCLYFAPLPRQECRRPRENDKGNERGLCFYVGRLVVAHDCYYPYTFLP